MTYRTIVVGTDGSATARIAEQTATLLARASDARLLIASAYRDGPEPAEAVLDAAAVAAREVWPRVEIRAARGDPASVLVDLARDEGADLLVVGNRGMTGRAAMLIGSVPDAVSHSAPCDLLIVKTSGVAGADRGDGTYRRMLIATDASQTSLQAVRRGFGLAQRIGARPVLFYGGHPKTAEIVFREVAREFLPAGMLETASAPGDPADGLTRTAERDGYDLVVIGNKGMPGGRFHIGTIPNRVSHQAPTDLLIVKTTAAAADELGTGEGAVVTIDGESVAVYRDDAGELHRLSPRCTHMGCTVGWNDAERTWDCPCHGSRYDALGQVIHGPATDDLAPLARPVG